MMYVSQVVFCVILLLEAYVFQENVRAFYWPSMQRVTCYLLLALFVCMLIPWLPIWLLLALCLLLEAGTILLYKDHGWDHIVLLASYLVAAGLLYIFFAGRNKGMAEIMTWQGALVLAFCAGILQVFYLAQKAEDHYGLYDYLFLSLALCAILLGLYLLAVDITDIVIWLFISLLYALGLFLYRGCFCLEKRQIHELKAQAKVQRSVQNKELYERIQKENTYILKTMHDMKKQLSVLVEMEERQETSSPTYESYRQALLTQINGLIYCQKSGDALIDKILLSYYPHIYKANIQFQMESDTIDYSFMNPVDRSALLCNLLDNALRSCEACEKPFILLRMVKQDGFIVWKMKNSCIENNEGQADGFAHGFGMANMEEIAKRYDGYLQASFEPAHQLFRTTLFFALPLMSETKPLV